MERKYCEQCGEPLKPHYKVCPNCGHHLKSEGSYQPPPPRPSANRRTQDEGDTSGWAILGFFFPLIGLIMFLIWQNDRPQAAGSAGKGALIGVIVRAVLVGFIGTASL